MDHKKYPSNWVVSLISDVVYFQEGPGLRKFQYKDSGIPFLNIQTLDKGFVNKEKCKFLDPEEVKKKYQHFLLETDDIVCSSSGTIGKTAVIREKDKPLMLNTSVIRFRPWAPSLFSKEYLHIFLKSQDFISQALAASTGSAQVNFGPTHLKTFIIPIPPLNEQKRIVAKIEELFSELDKGIESLQTAREQLKVYRQAVLKHAFEGKLTEQWRKDNADKLESPEQLLARIQKERDTRYQQQLEEWKTAVKQWESKGKEGKKPGKPVKPSSINQAIDEELPELPLGWMWLEYLGLCELIRNGISAKPSGDSGSKIFRISAVRAMKFDLSDIRYLQNEDGQYDDFFLENGDLVFTRYNGTRDFVGVCAEYRGYGSHLYPDKLIRTKLAVSSIAPSFLEKAINCGGSRRYMEKRIRTTAGQSGISGGDVKSMPVPICSALEQEMINSYIEEQLSKIALMEDEIEVGLAKAETLRQSILKKAFSGQLVPQDPSDEPASELLARIQAEKTALSAKAKKTSAKRGRQAKGVSQ